MKFLSDIAIQIVLQCYYKLYWDKYCDFTVIVGYYILALNMAILCSQVFTLLIKIFIAAYYKKKIIYKIYK